MKFHIYISTRFHTKCISCKHGFIENGENYNEILVVCGLHDVTEEFPIKSNYKVPKKRIEVLLFRHGLPSSHVITCAGCDNCFVSIHDAIHEVHFMRHACESIWGIQRQFPQ